MSTWLLLVVLAAALACPLHMLWAMRRGERPLCCPPRTPSDEDALRERQRALAAQIAERTAPAGRSAIPDRGASL